MKSYAFITDVATGTILKTCLAAVVLGAWLWLYLSKRRTVKLANELPALKLRIFHILGHAQGSLYLRLLKTPFPAHVYDFQFLCGYYKIFKNEKLANAWQIYNPFVLIFKAESVEVVLNHSTELKKAWFYSLLHPWLGTGLLTSEAAKWKTRRKLLTPAFHFNILKDFLLTFNKQSKVLVKVLEKHTSDDFINIVPFISRCSLDIICESILGAELHTQTNPSNPYVKSVTNLTSAVFERTHAPHLWPEFLFKISPLGRKFAKDLTVVQDFTYKLIAEKKKAKLEQGDIASYADEPDRGDIYVRNKRALLDLLLDEHIKNNSLSENDIAEEVDTFTFEGHDTTAMGISWSLYLIGLYPHVQAKIHEEIDSILGEDDRDVTTEDLKDMKYLECVIKETLRLYPSVPVFGRQLSDDLQIDGYTIPKGSTCMVFPYALHRDPEVFPNPEKFDPDRFTPENSAGRHPFSYVPFSAGPRNCIGQRFAMMEGKAVISAILRKYKLKSLDHRDKIQVVDEIVLRPFGALRIQIRLRDHT